MNKPIIRSKDFQTKQETYLDYSCYTELHHFCEKEIIIDGVTVPCHCECHRQIKTGKIHTFTNLDTFFDYLTK